jgi:hypothetical protein
MQIVSSPRRQFLCRAAFVRSAEQRIRLTVLKINRENRKIFLTAVPNTYSRTKGPFNREAFSADACRSTRTCRLRASRVLCLWMEVTCNGQAIYRLLIPRIRRWRYARALRVACSCYGCCFVLFRCNSDAHPAYRGRILRMCRILR